MSDTCVFIAKLFAFILITAAAVVKTDWVEIPQNFQKVLDRTDTHTYVEILHDYIHKTTTPRTYEVKLIRRTHSETNHTTATERFTIPPIHVTASTIPTYSTTDKYVNSTTSIFGFDSFIKIIKKLQDSFTQHAPRTFNSKRRYLRSIQDDLLLNIEDRLSVLWPVEPRSASRTDKYDDGHLDFPSAEGALMTISFLTFAVFLIKLVLQVIQAIKGKKQMQVVASVGRNFDNHKLETRSIAENKELAVTILQSIEEYRLKLAKIYNNNK